MVMGIIFLPQLTRSNWFDSCVALLIAGIVANQDTIAETFLSKFLGILRDRYLRPSIYFQYAQDEIPTNGQRL